MTRRPARIDNAQPSSTSAAGEQAREQRAATTTRLDAALLSERVDGDMALVPLKLTPIDIAFVMILEQHFPRSKGLAVAVTFRSEEHTSELQSLMRISYAVFCLKKKKE